MIIALVVLYLAVYVMIGSCFLNEHDSMGLDLIAILMIIGLWPLWLLLMFIMIIYYPFRKN